MQSETTIQGNEGYTIHIELKDFDDILELVAGIQATIVNRFCNVADCNNCRAASEKGLCKAGSCAAEIIDYLRSESKRKRQ